MSERDIPSVPVTTLAGLNSLSDLLSELPVPESLNNVANLNRSLLFHTLVANESNNLLSIRDDNLVKQLVNAIEQTNSDNIELKPQFAVPQHGTSISSFPELLQGIYNYQPTVFNNAQCSSKFYHLNFGNENREIDHSCSVSNPADNKLSIESSSNHYSEYPDNRKSSETNFTSLFSISFDKQGLQDEILCHQEQAAEMGPRRSRRNLVEEVSPNHQEKIVNTQSLEQQYSLSCTSDVENCEQKAVEQNILEIQKSCDNHIEQQSFNDHEIGRRSTTDVSASHIPPIKTNFVQQEDTTKPLESFVQIAPVSIQENDITKNESMIQTHVELHIIQQEPQESCNAEKSNLQELNCKSESFSTENNFGIFHNMNQNKEDGHANQDVPMDETKIISLENNKKDAVPMLTVSTDSMSQVRVCINRIKAEDVRLLQLSIKEFVQKSPEIAKKMGLPFACSSILISGEDGSFPNISGSVDYQNPIAATNQQQISDDLQRSNDSEGNFQTQPESDTFTQMKADEKRVISKRKMPNTIDDIPPEHIYTKPKVRRVERIKSTVVPKWSKEEISRSQTYQQFMRNMEQIIELLDDTESPNFDVEEVDENVECISAKMLLTMSNDVAKLKAKHALDSIPKNKLTLLINYAMRNIYLAKNYSAGTDDDDDIVDDEVMERILNAIEACLLICNIYSTVNDLKFLQEDNISLIIKFVQFQFRETIFPSFDPVYTVKNMKKSDGRKKHKAHHNHNRNLQLFYSKAVELMKVFVTLFDKCIFVDTIVLPLSTVAIEPFFVDNIDTLQFVCLELVTTIFRKEKYDKIRSSILGDILASIDRLPSSKKNLRPFKLANNVGNIQMVSALVLQLIQCATILPDSLSERIPTSEIGSRQQINDNEERTTNPSENKHPSHDVVILKKYDVAISIGGNFLTTFLNKCKSRSNETDFRPLFENFIHDLLATVNKPEWPASELLLSLLGTMLVRYVSNKTIEQSIRLVSLDYLGIVAARLRKDTVESRCKVHIIDSMIKSIKLEQEKEGDLADENTKIKLDIEEERTLFLQNILLDFLAVNAQEENLIWDYARHFYLAQWYRDIIYQRRRITEGDKSFASRKKPKKNKRRLKDGSSESSGNSSDEQSDIDTTNDNSRSTKNVDHELHVEIFNVLDERKKYLLRKIKPFIVGDLAHSSQHHIKTYIDYNNANLIAQYLATKRPFSQSFDGYLKKIILVVNEPSIAVRTRAMKCLANIVEVDPMVLKRKDMQMGVNQKFLDAAISVREAAVDLVGKFVLSNEELIDQYYDMLSTRILDTGVSVRKRVIKILRDICIEYPDFQKIPEICVKMIRRVNDEEGIQKLVTEVFMKMWFVPCSKNDKHGIQRKINQIIDVVNTAHDTGTTWLEGLLTSIFQPKENLIKLEGNAQELIKKNTEPLPEIVLACQQLADGLVDRLIELEDTDNDRMLGCITTLHLLAKVRPQLLVRHAMTIEPYLNIKCHPSTAPKFICAVADILEKVVPLVNNASESFLATLEEHLMLLVVSFNQAVVTSCVSCLGALINKITKNYKLIRDCFQKFYRILDHSKNQVLQNNHSIDSIYTPMFRRSLFTIGILMRYFDFKSSIVIGDLPITICDDAFECLMFFVQCSNNEIRKQALIAIGSFCVMNEDYLTKSELKNFYCDLLRMDTQEAGIKIICMRNIWIYLTESEMYMHNKEKEWEKQCKNEDLKEMNDVSSGMASRIIQLYLQDILECFLHRDDSVRLWAVKVVQIVLRQGLVHPVRMVPYLICLSTDSKIESAHRADALLKEIDRTYSGFVNMKVQFGLQLCFRLQEILQSNIKGNSSAVIRGYVKRPNDIMPTALNDFLYTLLRATKPQRRALVQTVTKQFDDQRTSLRQMLYIADNLAYFPYVVQDEPLYLIHQIDLLISMAGTNLLSTFKECLKPGDNISDLLADDDDEEDPEILLKRLPEDTFEIQKCITSAQACMLLLILKDHLKDMYGLTDGKISRYSPSEQKIYEKSVTRKVVPDFNPKSIIDLIKQLQQEHVGSSGKAEKSSILNEAEKMDIVAKYLDFKQLMLKLDPEDVDSDEDYRDKSRMHNSVTGDSSSLIATGNEKVGGQVSDLQNISGEIDIDGSNVTTNSNVSIPNKIFSPNLNNYTPETKAVPLNSTRVAKPSIGFSKSLSTSSGKKQRIQRTKRKKRKVISSDDEIDDDDCCSDEYIT